MALAQNSGSMSPSVPIIDKACIIVVAARTSRNLLDTAKIAKYACGELETVNGDRSVLEPVRV